MIPINTEMIIIHVTLNGQAIQKVPVRKSYS